MASNKVVLFVVNTKNKNADTLVKKGSFENSEEDALRAFVEARYEKYGVSLRSGHYSVSDFETPKSVDNCALCCIHKHNTSGDIVASYAVTILFDSK